MMSFWNQAHSRFPSIILYLSPILLLSASAALYLATGPLPDDRETKVSQHEKRAHSRAQELLFRGPIHFEENRGQFEEDVRFVSRGAYFTAVMRDASAELILSGLPGSDSGAPSLDLVHLEFSDSREPPYAIRAEGESNHKTHYLLGPTSEDWTTEVRNFSKVHYEEVFPGVDCVFYGNMEQLEYDLVVSPGTDPSTVRLKFSGQESLDVDDKGRLVLETKVGPVRFSSPVVYQVIDSQRRSVEGEYALLGSREVGFSVGPYDPAHELVIDPILAYSTYLETANFDHGVDVAVDSEGNSYVGGTASGTGIPLVMPFQDSALSSEAFLVKFDPEGEILFSTYLGGSAREGLTGIGLLSDNSIALTGWTESNNFPTAAAFQDRYEGLIDAFVTRLNSTGDALVFSTYLGGTAGEADDLNFPTDLFGGLAVDSQDNIHVAGVTSSPDFPLEEAFQTEGPEGRYDGWVAKFTASGDLIYSSFLGGISSDHPRDVAVDSGGNTIVVGWTKSSDFPLAQAFRTTRELDEGFISRISPTGGLLSSSYVGADHNDRVAGVAIDSDDRAVLFGDTTSGNFPVIDPPAGLSSGSGMDLFLARLSGDYSSLEKSFVFGGLGEDVASGLSLPPDGPILLTGQTRSADFPLVDPIQGLLVQPEPSFFVTDSAADVFVTVFTPDLGEVHFSTFLGSFGHNDRGNRIAGAGQNLYVTGSGDNPAWVGLEKRFPLSNPVQSLFQGGGGFFSGISGFAARISLDAGALAPPLQDQPWTRHARLDTNGNGVPDPGDEVVGIWRQGDSVFMSSGRWGVAEIRFDEPDEQGRFRRIRNTNILERGVHGFFRGEPAVRGRLETEVNIPAVNGTGAADSVDFTQTAFALPGDEMQTEKSGSGHLLDLDQDGIFDAITAEGAELPEIVVSIVRVDVNGDGNADFVTIPWSLIYLAGVRSKDGVADPQVFIPLADTDEDGVPDRPAFDFDLDGSADSEFALIPPLAGSETPSPFQLNFAHFASGKGAFSQILLFNRDLENEATARIVFRDDQGQELGVALASVGPDSQIAARMVVIPPGGVRQLITEPTGEVIGGTVQVRSDRPVEGRVLFGGRFGLAGVSSSEEMGTGFMMPVTQSLAAGGVETAVAIMNLEEREIDVVASLLDSAGTVQGQAQFTLPPLGHLARFVAEIFPTLVIDSFQGALLVESSHRMTATALQVRPQEFVTIPVTSMDWGRPHVYFAHLASAENLVQSEIHLLNLTTRPAFPQTSFWNRDGSAATMQVNGMTVNNNLNSNIPPLGSLNLSAENTGAGIPGMVATNSIFWAQRRMSGSLVYSGNIGAAGVSATRGLDGVFWTYVERSESREIDTGIAIASVLRATPVVMELIDEDGALLARTTVDLPAMGQIALFLDEIEWIPESGVTLDLTEFRGIIRVRGNSRLTAIGLQTRPGQLATMPVIGGSP